MNQIDYLDQMRSSWFQFAQNGLNWFKLVETGSNQFLFIFRYPIK